MSEDQKDATFDLDSDLFFRRLLRDLAGTLEEVVGLEMAEGYISTVGSQVGRWIDDGYRAEQGVDKLDAAQVADTCVDLKARIGGDFSLESQSDEKLVFGNRRCPFGNLVKDRPSLCMMTSNVFGRIAADNLGYARVKLDETIARGHAGCRVVVHLKPSTDSSEDEREYYGLSEVDD